MLEQFTWQQYILCISAASILYYLIIAMLYYRQEISDFFFRSDQGRPSGYGDLASQPDVRDQDIMGKPALDPGISSSAMEDVVFSQTQHNNDSQQLLGNIPDLLKEFETLINIVSETGESKEDFLSLFHYIISKYSNLTKTRYRSAINKYVLENAAEKLEFTITKPELNILWDSSLIPENKETY